MLLMKFGWDSRFYIARESIRVDLSMNILSHLWWHVEVSKSSVRARVFCLSGCGQVPVRWCRWVPADVESVFGHHAAGLSEQLKLHPAASHLQRDWESCYLDSAWPHQHFTSIQQSLFSYSLGCPSDDFGLVYYQRPELSLFFSLLIIRNSLALLWWVQWKKAQPCEHVINSLISFLFVLFMYVTDSQQSLYLLESNK